MDLDGGENIWNTWGTDIYECKKFSAAWLNLRGLASEQVCALLSTVLFIDWSERGSQYYFIVYRKYIYIVHELHVHSMLKQVQYGTIDFCDDSSDY